jgi:hypothetical protein
MSFFGGIAQSILSELFLDSLRSRKPPGQNSNKGCLVVLFVLVGLFSLLVVVALVTSDSKNKVLSRKIGIGDSVFVLEDRGISFYKIGKVKLDDYEQRKIKYAYEDIDQFLQINEVGDRFFFKNKTSFIGICIGLDSTTSSNKWIMIKPSDAVAHPPKPKDDYDFKTRRWKDKKYDDIHGSKLSKEFYVRSSQVTSVNNDKLFQ